MGAAVDVLRSVGVRVIGLAGTLVLARLLTPSDFGIVAVGSTVVTFGTWLSDGGIGAGLIRRAEPPLRSELRALLAFQLALTTTLAAGVAAVLVPFGEFGALTALMMVSLPIASVRAPGVILLERELVYRPLALLELVESIVYYAWAIAAVSRLEWGVWGLASATVARAIAGSGFLLVVSPLARMTPRASWALTRPLLGFGFRYQAVGIIGMLRDLAVNLVIAAVAGLSALGIWSVAYRVLQIPLLFLGSFWRVSFPAMSRLVSAGEDAGPTIERVLAAVAVASGFMIAPLVAATPAWVPALFGSQWEDVAPVIPVACLHLLVFGPLSVALLGFLWAVGEASAVVRATLVGIPLMAIALLPLLFVIGVPAVGFGWVAAGAGEGLVLVHAARKHAEFKIRPNLVPAAVCAVAGGSIGWVVTTHAGTTLVAGLVGALLALALYLAPLSVWQRRPLLDTARLAMRGLQGGLRAPR